MKTTKDTLTNNQIFGLRVRADEAGNRQLVHLIDGYLQRPNPADQQVILNLLNGDEERPGLLVVHTPSGWVTYELRTWHDVDLVRGHRVDRAIYIRGVYSVETIRHLPEIEHYLPEVLEPLRVDGARVEWYVDGPS